MINNIVNNCDILPISMRIMKNSVKNGGTVKNG